MWNLFAVSSTFNNENQGMRWVLFFDGDCAFCSGSVRRIFRMDRRGRIDFAPLQGALSGELGFSRHAATGGGGTLVLLRESDGAVFTRSDALIELARALGGGWRVFALAEWLPRAIRDRVYRCVAANRQRLAGRKASCVLPDPGLAARLRN